MKKQTLVIFSVCVLLALAFAGCGSQMTTASASGPENTSPAAETVQEATPTPTATPMPTATSVPEFTLAGQTIQADCTSLDLSALTHSEAEEAAAILAQLPALETVELGDLGDAADRMTPVAEAEEATAESAAGTADPTPSPSPAADATETTDASEGSDPLQWADIAALQQAAPGAVFHGTFTLYGVEASLSDVELNLNHKTVKDNGALVRQVITCMPSLNYLDMDTCGVDNEHMAALRDDFPAVKVVWRVWFGGSYSCRTDTEKILASCPGLGGALLVSNTQALKYCTDVKYLDLGHNEELGDVSYVAYMPHLQVAILAMIFTTDISPLANCPEMEFLEIQTNYITDLSPLSGMKNLKHLNIGHNYYLTDITPLYGLTQLERLWIGCMTPIPTEQVEEMQRRAPNCTINTEVGDPHDGWRYGTERYELLVKQFGYDSLDYTVPWKEPKSEDTAFRADETGNPVLTQYRFDETVNQILLVTYTGDSKGTAEFYKRCGSASWVKVFETTAVMGENGVGKTEEGDGKTPLGDFGVRCAFGEQWSTVDTELPYVPLISTVYACNEDCEYYNQLIDTGLTGHACTGEAMSTIMPEYTYGLVVDYNHDNVYPLGSAIFVHCLGMKDTTSGCIAIAQNYMLTVLQEADAGMRVVIVDGTESAE